MANNWAPLDVTWTSLLDGFRILVTTDVPCHLYMAWSLVTPKKHNVEILIRGLRLAQDPYYCMAAPTDNDQEEPGDTLTHTFDKRTWPICETRYFYFWGFVGPQQSPSASAIFSLHRGETPLPTEWGWHWNTPDNRTVGQTHGLWAPAHDNPIGIIFVDHVPPLSRLHAGATLTVSYHIQRGFLRFDTSDIPAGSVITAATLRLWIQGWLMTSSVIYPHIFVTPGVQSTPIVPSDYGDQLPITTVGGQIRLDALVPNSWAQIPLNAYGLIIITQGGTTKFCLRQEMDVIDSAPPLGANAVWFNSYDGPGVYRPQLNIWYIPP